MLEILLACAIALAIWFELPLSAACFGMAAGLALANRIWNAEPAAPEPTETIDYLADDADLLYHLVVNPGREARYAE